MESLIKNMLELIRLELSDKKITQSQFAKMMNVSTPTLKRWMSGKGVSLEVWLKMMSELGLSFNEIASQLNPRQFEQFTYSEKQEEVLAKHEGLLPFFHEILNGQTQQQIQADYDLSNKGLMFYLSQLETIGLIRWHEGNQVKTVKAGEPKWRVNGPLAKKFRSQVFDELITVNQNAVDFKMEVFQLSENDADHLIHLRNEYFRYARLSEKRAKLNQVKTKMYGVVHYMSPYSPLFLREIPDRS